MPMHAGGVPAIGRSAGFLVVAVILAAPAGTAALRSRPVSHTVNIEALQFSPQVLVVNRGDRVTWINKDPFPHTVTARARSFDSANIAPGQSWSFVAGTEGAYDYGCALHPSMNGQLVVKQAAPAGNHR